MSSLAGSTPLEECLRYVDNLVARLALLGVVAILLAWRPGLCRGFGRRFVGEAGPEVVALMRIYAAGVLFVSAWWEEPSSLAPLPRDLLHQHGLMKLVALLPGFDAFVASGSALAIFDALTTGALLLAALGVRSRWTVPLGALLYYVLAGLMRSPFWSYHTGLIPWYLLVVVAFCPASDAWSVDSLRRRKRGLPPRRAGGRVYGWARFVGAFCVAFPYTEAGLSKLCNGGWLWWEAVNMRSILFMDSLHPMEFDVSFSLALAEWPDAFFAAIGLMAVCGEVVMVLALLSRRWRLVLPAMMIGMHVGILFTQNILFFDLIALLTMFYAWMLLDRDPKSPWYMGDLWPLRGYVRPRASRAERVESGSALRLRRLFVALAAVLLFCWAFAIEFFPFTAMQMYSRKRDSGQVEYYQSLAHYRDGRIERAYIERALPALRDGRFRRALRLCFQPDERSVCEELLELAGRRLSSAGDPIDAIVVRHRRWDFAEDVEDPDHGETLASVRVPVPTHR